MKQIVFFLEEQSAKVMLEGFLPKISNGFVNYKFIVFEGKQDLDSQLERRVRGYRVPNANFVILRDQDSANCYDLKQNLGKKCIKAGRPNTLIRIACHELESWYLADLTAVEAGLQISGIVKYQNKRYCQNPDLYPSPFRALIKIAPSYQKVSGSRAIGPCLDPDNTRSKSYSNFVSGLRRLISY
jgi:hypothetical protein